MLEHTRKHLERKKTPVPGHELEESQFDPTSENTEPPENDQNESGKSESWSPVKKGLSPSQVELVKRGGFLLAGLLAVVIIGWLAIVIKGSFFNADRVMVELSGPERVESGSPTTFTIVIDNNNRADLENVILDLTYPENFSPDQSENLSIEGRNSSVITVGFIDGNSEERISFSGSFIGKQDQAVLLRARVGFVAKDTTTVYETSDQISTIISSSPLSLEISAPFEVADGDLVEYTINWTNVSQRRFSDVRIRGEYPAGFIFEQSEPRPSQSNNVWQLGAVEPKQKGVIRVRGGLESLGQVSKEFVFAAGAPSSDGIFVPYTEVREKTDILRTPLAITHTANGLKTGSVNPGDTLAYEIIFRNEDQLGVQEGIVTMELIGSVLDFSRLNLQGRGFYNPAENKITWKASDVFELRNLEPQGEGKIQFTIPVVSEPSIVDDNSREFLITSKASIDSPTIETPLSGNKLIASDRVVIRVGTKLNMEPSVSHFDQTLENTGPIPPVVGETTTYTGILTITNSTNIVNDGKVVFSLPSGVRWTGAYEPSTETVSYNERINEVVWEIGNIENGVGFSKPERTLHYQVALTPGPEMINLSPELAKDFVFTGVDQFTELPIEVNGALINTRVTNDPDTRNRDYKVIKK